MRYLIFIATLTIAGSASACSFGPDADLFKTAEENFEDSEYKYVLAGTIINKTESSQMEQQYEFKINSIHKGQISTDTTILNSPGHSCGFFSAEGVHMLVFLRELGVIDESNPRYKFETVAQATQAGDKLKPQLLNNPIPGACTKEYRPICAAVQVQCVQAPCPPIDTTFSNSCVAEQAQAVFQYKGACIDPKTEQPKESSRIKNLPITKPEIGFLEPPTPPPYDNSIIREEEPKKNWWQQFKSWITRMLSF